MEYHPNCLIRITDPDRQATICLSDEEVISESSILSTTNPLYLLIHATRQQLLNHQSYRQPYLKCLQKIYHHSDFMTATQRRRLLKSQPHEPTDADVREFVLAHWPEVWLKQERDMVPYHLAGAGQHRPRDGAIHMSYGLAVRLVEKELFPETDGISLAELRIAFLSILLYELGRLLLSWWSKPESLTDDLESSFNHIRKPRRVFYRRRPKPDVETPRMTSRDLDYMYWWYSGKGRGGHDIQTCFFGGVVIFWHHHVSNDADRELEHIQGIGIHLGEECAVLDKSGSARIFDAFCSTPDQLPLFKPSILHCPFKSHLQDLAHQRNVVLCGRGLCGSCSSIGPLICPAGHSLAHGNQRANVMVRKKCLKLRNKNRHRVSKHTM